MGTPEEVLIEALAYEASYYTDPRAMASVETARALLAALTEAGYVICVEDPQWVSHVAPGIVYFPWDGLPGSNQDEGTKDEGRRTNDDCPTCGGEGFVDGWPGPGQGDAITEALRHDSDLPYTLRVQHLCPTCGGDSVATPKGET